MECARARCTLRLYTTNKKLDPVDGRWAMDYGLRSVDCGLWTVDCGLWTMYAAAAPGSKQRQRMSDSCSHIRRPTDRRTQTADCRPQTEKTNKRQTPLRHCATDTTVVTSVQVQGHATCNCDGFRWVRGCTGVLRRVLLATGRCVLNTNVFRFIPNGLLWLPMAQVRV